MVWYMMSTRQDNYVINPTSVVYVENKTELPWPVYHEN